MPKRLRIIMSNRFTTKFMQHADLFEPSKVVVEKPLMATLAAGVLPTAALIERMRTAVPADGPYGLVAIFDADQIYYQDPDVKSISDGTHWSPLDRVIKMDQAMMTELEANDADAIRLAT